jgi:hypothetical protein
VIDDTGTQMSFVPTGGLLPPASYTVTLRSSSTGFRAADGSLLDGNRDRSSGGNYVASFSVAAPLSMAVTVSIPDVARGPGQQVQAPAGGIGLPLRLSAPQAGVTQVILALLYDPALLTITTASLAPGLPTGSMVTLDTSTTGRAVVTLSLGSALGPGTLDIVHLTARVPDNAPYRAKQVLDLADVEVRAGNLLSLPVLEDDGLQAVIYFGDATGNAGYSSSDAVAALRAAVGADSGLRNFALLDPRIVGDISGNLRLDATDSLRILQEAVGIDRPEIPPLPPNPPTTFAGGPDPRLSLPRNLGGRSGDVVAIPVMLDVSDGLEAVDLALSYDARRLELLSTDDVQRGSLTGDFDLFLVNHDAAAGNLRIGLGRTAGPIRGRESGSVVELRFRIKADAPIGRAVVNLRNDLLGSRTLLNEGGLVLGPTPSNAAGDVLDGAITVQRFRLPAVQRVVMTDGSGQRTQAADVLAALRTSIRFPDNPAASILTAPPPRPRAVAEHGANDEDDRRSAAARVEQFFRYRRDGDEPDLADLLESLTADRTSGRNERLRFPGGRGK